jgi:hypothetical protein
MMRQLSREMDRLMDSFFERGFGSLLRDSSTSDAEWQGRSLWAPQIDVQRRGDAIVVRADLHIEHECDGEVSPEPVRNVRMARVNPAVAGGRPLATPPRESRPCPF